MQTPTFVQEPSTNISPIPAQAELWQILSANSPPFVTMATVVGRAEFEWHHKTTKILWPFHDNVYSHIFKIIALTQTPPGPLWKGHPFPHLTSSAPPVCDASTRALPSFRGYGRHSYAKAFGSDALLFVTGAYSQSFCEFFGVTTGTFLSPKKMKLTRLTELIGWVLHGSFTSVSHGGLFEHFKVRSDSGVGTKSTLRGWGEGRSSKPDGLSRGRVLGEVAVSPLLGEAPVAKNFGAFLGSSGELSCTPAIRPAWESLTPAFVARLVIFLSG